MFNKKYISDFGIKQYNEILNNRHALKEIADAYINQYNNPSYECTIAFKESLDHFVLQQIKSNNMNGDKLKNYYDFLFYIYNNRKSESQLHLEYNTNVVLRDKDGQNLLMQYYRKYHTNINYDTVVQDVNRNNMTIKNISNKMKNGLELSQLELNLLSDYLYTTREFNNNVYGMFIEYLLNNNLKINNSPQIMAAYIAYLPKIFGDNCEYSRIILSNGYGSGSKLNILPSYLNKERENNQIAYLGLYSTGSRFISVDWNLLKDLDLNSSLSLNYSRIKPKKTHTEVKKKDLYWITMVCFHELTHQVQNRLKTSTSINSSGLAQIIKEAKHVKTDNIEDHDSIESEIEADENAWQKMFYFILKYEKNKESRERNTNKCLTNQKAVFARRAILTKYNSKDNFFADDMKIISSYFKNEDAKVRESYRLYFKKMLSKYPMMNKIFSDNGEVKTTLLLNENITSKNATGLDNNIMSSELSNYILTYGYKTLKNHILNDELSQKQVDNLLINIYNTYHLDKMFVDSLSKTDLDQYKDTTTNFDFTNIRNKYLEKFKNVAELVYKERELLSIIKKRYPEYNVEYSNPNYVIYNYIDMFEILEKNSPNGIMEEEVNDIISQYENSGDTVLVELANQTKTRVVARQNKMGPLR